MKVFGSLFSGIGGLDLGLERAGMKCAWQVEIDDYANRVLEKHWPNVPRWRDVREFIADCHGQRREGREEPDSQQNESEQQASRRHNAKRLCVPANVDGICGGFPCQPVSVAGARQGDADERWLWPAFLECIRILEPRWVLVENVRGLLSAGDVRGELIRGILRDLANLGFDAEWQVIPAGAFDLPHLRERVFIVAYTNSTRPQERQSECENACQEQSPTIGTDWRTVEPTVCRSNHGIPDRIHRIRCLGNAVAPPVAEWIGKQILRMEA